MNLPNPHPVNSPQDSKLIFDHEKLRVYQQLLRFISWVSPLIEEAKTLACGKAKEVCDQLDRASLSSILNTAEGNGKRRGQLRAKYCDDARGSATECAACLDALVAKSIFKADRILEGKEMLVQIVSMLCGLVDRFDEPGCCCREDVLEYSVPREERKRMRRRKRTN
jgi:four helix bundle protein